MQQFGLISLKRTSLSDLQKKRLRLSHALLRRNLVVSNRICPSFSCRRPCMPFYMGVSENSGFYPQIIHFNRVFHYKPSIFGVPLFLEIPRCFKVVCVLVFNQAFNIMFPWFLVSPTTTSEVSFPAVFFWLLKFTWLKSSLKLKPRDLGLVCPPATLKVSCKWAVGWEKNTGSDPTDDTKKNQWRKHEKILNTKSNFWQQLVGFSGEKTSQGEVFDWFQWFGFTVLRYPRLPTIHMVTSEACRKALHGSDVAATDFEGKGGYKKT